MRGLGRVSERYTAFDDEADPGCRHSSWAPVVITVAGKGEIDASLSATARCDPAQQFIGSASFTITGGTGRYDGATGSGTQSAGTGALDRWDGTLTVPGLMFDTTPPAIHGATSKTARVRRGLERVRVTYEVTAADAVDGAIPVTCRPRSGSRFKIGRTHVVCSATDSSANTAAARFTVTVRRR